MRRNFDLILATAALALLVLVCVLTSARSIQEDLLADVASRLVEASLSTVDAQIDGREIRLVGTVASEASHARAQEVAESVWGIAEVHNQVRVLGTEPQEGSARGNRP